MQMLHTSPGPIRVSDLERLFCTFFYVYPCTLCNSSKSAPFWMLPWETLMEAFCPADNVSGT